ncbi:MAG: DUF962 domain-containing protein [Bacteriovoracaceae bacterium]|jgi:uncharacterized membrane protein YGL010W|nr:DUF962 domain-containing protein [Bacteriovoracaceae bacterium]
MKTLDEWMREYAVSHCNPINQIIHKICVPLIMFSLLGLMWLIPTPELFSQFKFMNWSSIFGLFCLVFYARLSLKMFFGMLLMIIPMYLAIIYLSLNLPELLLNIMIVIFICSWILQIIGHKIEGKKPSFLKDLSFLLIGPLWVLKSLYNKLGIN